MAPVRIISTFECFNFDPQKFELLLHNFFGVSFKKIKEDGFYKFKR